MALSGRALSRQRAEQMLSRMAAILDWEDEEEVKKALKRLGLIPGEESFEESLAIWRDLR